MTTLLDTQINTENEAAVGRFFNGQAAFEGLAAEPLSLTEILNAQHDLAKVALKTLVKIEEAEAITQTNSRIPGLIDQSIVNEAHAELMDKGAIWRRSTDTLAYGIAQALPGQNLGALVLGGGEFHVADGKLLEVKDETTVYQSVISQQELNKGLRIADRDQWTGLLYRIVLKA